MQLKSSQLRVWFVSSVLAVLAACGGGGGGGSTAPVTSTETFQLRTAYVNYLTDTRSLPFALTGTVSNVSVSGGGSLTQGSMSSTTFEGQAAQAKVTTVTGTVRGNGQSVSLASTTTAYVDSNYNPLGFSGSEYEVVTSSAPIPATARVNDTAVWYVTDRYTSSGKTSRVGTTTSTFVLEPDTASTALLKIIEVERNTSNTVTSTSTITFRMTPAGALTRLSETVLEGTTSLTVTY